ncbi:MAG TPA: radical SAM protein [Pyrinomonadaceae bacterium]
MSTSPIDVKRVSPLDLLEPAPSDLIQIKPLATKLHWEASRYNLRTTSPDGSYVLWNSYTGAICVIKPQQREGVQALLKQGYTGEPKGVVKYLVDNGFMVPKGTNEYRQVQLSFGQSHYRHDVLELILLASEDCNFRCNYCYEDFARGTMLPSVREGVKKMVERKAPYLRQLVAGWFGGEPLYGFQAMEDLGPFFVEIAEKYSLNYTSHITTNAYLLTPDVAEKLLAWKVLNYQITIDGMREQHDAKRPARDGSGTFDQIISNLIELKKRPEWYRVRIRVNYDKENHPYIEDLLLLLEKEFGGDDRFAVAFHSIGRWGGPNDQGLEVCGVDEAKLVKERLRNSAKDKGFRPAGTLRDMNSFGKNVCYAARPYNFIVGADGKLMKCTIVLDKKDNNIVGHITPEGDMVMNVDNMALWTEPAFQSDTGCQKCAILPTCLGISCPLIRIENNESPCDATPKKNVRNELLLAMETAEQRSQEVLVNFD